MEESIALFAAFFFVAIVPGPLAIVAFYGGTKGMKQFLPGLAGQLSGLIAVTSLIVLIGETSGIMNGPWFLSIAAVALIWLGFNISLRENKGRPVRTLTFASTFMMAAANPKAIIGFGPPLLVFHRDGVSAGVFLYSLAVLIVAVSLTMIFYFSIGMALKEKNAIALIRRASGAVLILFGILILLRELLQTFN